MPVKTEVVEGTASWEAAGKNPRYRPRTLEQKLGYLVEECGEMLAAVGKMQRWGPLSCNPEPGSNGERNAEWVLRESKDLEAAIDIVRHALDELLGMMRA